MFGICLLSRWRGPALAADFPGIIFRCWGAGATQDAGEDPLSQNTHNQSISHVSKYTSFSASTGSFPVCYWNEMVSEPSDECSLLLIHGAGTGTGRRVGPLSWKRNSDVIQSCFLLTGVNTNQ